MTTFDLVLISRHILGLEPLDSPYKMIAADANKSNSITTFDVVELRKLILGIYNELPQAPSWRFVDKAFVFPSPANPFSIQFPETISIPPSSEQDFYGIKVGDVNGTALPNDNRPSTAAPTGERPVSLVGWQASPARAGAALTLPVTYAGGGPLAAFQLGLRFDPSALALIGPSAGDLAAVAPDAFGLAKAGEGELRVVWLPDYSEPEPWAMPGATLFHLTFRALRDLSGEDFPLWLDGAVLPNAAWLADDTECDIRQGKPAQTRERAEGAASALAAVCLPNPTTGDATLRIACERATRARAAVFGPFGNAVVLRDLALEAGEQTLALPEFASLPAGVYVWKVWTQAGEKAQGHLVKQ
ncbi:MAG: hypothetical protein KF734_09285 [Saprospiraceae bacterium]|nr:hypothetical protein [Saprospiraceae bacterium]